MRELDSLVEGALQDLSQPDPLPPLRPEHPLYETAAAFADAYRKSREESYAAASRILAHASRLDLPDALTNFAETFAEEVLRLVTNVVPTREALEALVHSCALTLAHAGYAVADIERRDPSIVKDGALPDDAKENAIAS